MDIFRTTEGVVDVDWAVENDQRKYVFEVDREKAMLAGVPAEQISGTLAIALGGSDVSTLRLPEEESAVGIHMRLGEELRSSVDDLEQVHVQAPSGEMIPLANLVQVHEAIGEKSISRKNQRRVG